MEQAGFWGYGQAMLEMSSAHRLQSESSRFYSRWGRTLALDF
jgi:hypothetical protein